VEEWRSLKELKWMRRQYELRDSTLRVHEVPADFASTLRLSLRGIRERVVEFTVVGSDVRLVGETVLGDLVGLYDVVPLESTHPRNQQVINYKLELWMGNAVVDELRKREITPLSVFTNPRAVPCLDDNGKAREIDECLSVRAIIIGVKEVGDSANSLVAIEFEKIFKLKRANEYVVKSE